MANQEKNIVCRRRGVGEFHIVEEEIPLVKPRYVLVRVHALSLNYRDVVIANGKYSIPIKENLIPASDGAGEVVEVGEGVERVKKGDRVMPIISPWLKGNIELSDFLQATGAAVDGVAAKYILVHEEHLVHIPEHLSYSEAATLPCAAVTAWASLFEGPHPLRPGETVLVQGTGGVSVFALQLAAAAGACVIVTSSSNEKLRKAKELGASQLINYKETPDWDKEVLKVYPSGVDHIIEVGGKDTAAKSCAVVKLNGNIHVVGGLSGFEGGFTSVAIVSKVITIRGILAGSRDMFEKMCIAIAQSKLKPQIDHKAFELAQYMDALKYLESGAHFGKVVVHID